MPTSTAVTFTEYEPRRGSARDALRGTHGRIRLDQPARVELADVVAPHQHQRAAELAAEDFEHPRDAVAAGDREPVHERPPDEDGTRAEAQRLDDVGAAADAAVEQHLGAAGDGVRDLRQHVERPDARLELPAAVVRDDDAVDAE